MERETLADRQRAAAVADTVETMMAVSAYRRPVILTGLVKGGGPKKSTTTMSLAFALLPQWFEPFGVRVVAAIDEAPRTD
jgi:hypothetical protein